MLGAAFALVRHREGTPSCLLLAVGLSQLAPSGIAGFGNPTLATSLDSEFLNPRQPGSPLRRDRGLGRLPMVVLLGLSLGSIGAHLG
jgi:hypothetical protein